MKIYTLLVLLMFVGMSSTMVSCTTMSGDGVDSEGISASETSFNRQSVYEMQDRAFRQLAY